MKHFVVKDIGNNIFRNTRPVETTIHNDLLESRVEAAKLRPPGTLAPRKARCWQGIIEILAIQAIKQHLKMVMFPSGTVLHPPSAEPAQLQKSLARRARIGKIAIALE